MDKNYVMLDSSVWINYFRKGKSVVEESVNALLDANRVAICGMIELEILQGLRDSEESKIQDLFSILRYMETTRADYVFAGLTLNRLRKKGITIPSSNCLIAAHCIHQNISLFTLDKDFDYIPNLKMYKT